MRALPPDPQRRSLLALAPLSLLLSACRRGAPPEVVLVAAASLRPVLPLLVAAYREAHPGLPLVVSYGSSGALERQVEAGAPADGVLFVHPAPVDALIQKGLADPATRRVIATNRLVLVGPRGGPKVTFETIDTLPADARIAIGDPAHVPAGQYAEQVLRRLGKWDAVESRLVFGGDVTAVLAYARRGEAAAAVVYATDVRGLDDVVVLGEPPAAVAPRVECVVAATRSGPRAAEAGAFFAFLGSPAAQEILRREGFGPP